MHGSDIEKIEQRFDIDLPGPYRQFLTQYPASLRRTDAAVWEVLDDADRIIAINELLEANHVTGWPDSFFAVGESGCGDYYGIDLDEGDGEIYFWNHETAEIDPSEGFPAVEEFAGYFLRMHQPSTRKWWHFWRS